MRIILAGTCFSHLVAVRNWLPGANKLLPYFRISYLDIFKVVELTCEKHQEELVATPSLEEIIHYDLWARDYAAGVQRSSGLTPVPA